ncbi:MAG: hypothetical protein ACOCX0_01765 [Bacteroidota bacterium]
MAFIRVYRHNKTAIRFFLGLGVILFIGGTGLFVYARWFAEQGKVTLFTANYITLAFQGVVAFWVGLYTIRNEKYFLEWNDEVICWWLPRKKKAEILKIADIRSVKKDRHKIVVGLENTQKEINLNFFFYPERKLIMEKFEAIRQSLSQSHPRP